MIVDNDDTCLFCGLSKSGQFIGRRQGADEARVLIKCSCVSDDEVSKMIYDSEEFAYSVTSVSDPLAEELMIRNNSDSDRLQDRTFDMSSHTLYNEIEITLSPSLSSICFNRIEDYAEMIIFEAGHPGTNINGDLMLSSNVRFRIAAHTTHNGENSTNSQLNSFSHKSVTCNVKNVVSKFSCAPDITYKSSYEFDVIDWKPFLDNHLCKQSYSIMFIERICIIGDWLCRARKYSPDGVYSCEFEYIKSSKPSDEDVLCILDIIHSRFIHETNYGKYLRQEYIDILRHSARPTKDIKHIPGSKNSYRIKVDGEYAWVFDAGSIWYICRNDPKLTVVGYIMKQFISVFKALHTVIRVEQMVDGTLVLIDVLCLNGKVRDITRRYDDATTALKNGAIFPPNMIIRHEYNTMEEAQRARLTSDIPSDGIIIIEKNTSITYRIKNPTIDLLCTGKNLVTINENKRMSKVMDSLEGMQKNVIYECNIELCDNDKLKIIKAMPRYDKVVPNRPQVLKDIISVLKSDNMIDYTLIDRVSNYSFFVRKYMYSWANNRMRDNKLIIDVGSGRIQSISCIKENPNYSYLLCDPKLRIPNNIDSSKWLDATNYDDKSKLNLLERLHKGKDKMAYYRGSIESFFTSYNILSFVIDNRCMLIYCFSLSYMITFFNDMASRGAKQIGSCYIYDNIKEDSTLVDIGGIRLQAEDESRKNAIATFGNKVEYKEPLINSNDIRAREVDLAVNLPLTISDIEHDVRMVVSNIIVAKSF
ncbi:hypothetical protein HK099_003893 [Clydaea vesicula]|uniref:Uncharacterized protein n=1 Tax=Clydaea vesicula TaxID=447962 RepID=A0AAD5U4B2_9FUNG|nr:hypothetical protein HK099_003893 [Clydaea vesicula]